MPGCLKHEPIGAGATGPWPAAPAPGTFLNAEGKACPAAALAAKAGGARYVLIGEGHTAPCDHLVQAAVLEAMVQAGIRPAVGLEMVPVDLQPALDAFNAGATSVADLEKAVEWSRVWGYDYAMYAPIFTAAKKLGLPLYALNAPRELIREAAESGLENLSPEKRALLPARILPPPADQEQMLREQFQAHKIMGERAKDKTPGPADQSGETRPKPAKAKTRTHERNPGGPPAMAKASFERFLFVQSLWDTQMAERALAAATTSGRPVVILAGGGHVEFGHGIASRLATLDPDAKTVSVLPWRGGTPPEPGEAEVYFFCPEAHKSRLGFIVEMRGDKATTIEVEPGSKAERAGLLPGDVIETAADKPVTSLADLHQAAIAALTAGKPLNLTLARQGGEVSVSIEIGKK